MRPDLKPVNTDVEKAPRFLSSPAMVRMRSDSPEPMHADERPPKPGSRTSANGITLKPSSSRIERNEGNGLTNPLPRDQKLTVSRTLSYADGYIESAVLSNDEIQHAHRLSKRIIVLCDGTWKDGNKEEAEVVTNVLRLARCIYPEDRRWFPPVPQLVCYQSGLGTGDNVFDQVEEGATGAGIAAKIREAYTFIAQNYVPGDEILLFGFSRGAFTARTIAALICDLGVLPRTCMEDFYKIFQAYQDRKDPEKARKAEDYLARYKQGGPRNRIVHDIGPYRVKCVGVFDTVGALGLPGSFSQKDNRLLGFIDTNLSEQVEYAFHAIAINETRNDFKETLWNQTEEGRKKGQIMKQTWFAGAHSDIGGGYQGHDLADLTLTWMLANLDQHKLLSVDFDYLWTIPHPHASWGTLKPHDPRKNGIMALSFPTKRELPTAWDESTQQRFHASVVRQNPCAREILDALSKHPELQEPLLMKEEELKRRWARADLSHSLDDVGIGGMFISFLGGLRDKVMGECSEKMISSENEAAIMGEMQTERFW